MNTEFDARHPMVKECIEQGLCTNTLSTRLSQRIGGYWPYYCETCWIHCQQQSPTELQWYDLQKCECKNCSRMKETKSVVQVE